ncbi:hypothetical protein Lal_00033041 [Lupinus albus]|uniref:Putative cytochrome P450 n=1 Tax=Lupinus albus TaxID=3870 RepID=A0A6A4R7N2_LUPAL|nr:putative cytochrome P450 [Lupinus albus]KAF1898275.1 hypothetical protein Lal_00033041 [Lupinus albus]
MEIWFIILISISLVFLIKAIFSVIELCTKTKITNPLPPGPIHIPIITAMKWLTISFTEIESILKTLHAKYGPMVTLRIGSRTAIFIADRSLAHQALIQNGTLFAHRPRSLPVNKITSSNQHNISSASYGPTWRVLRRNLAAEMLHPSRVKSFTQTRKWVLDALLNHLHSDSKSNHSVKVKDHFQLAMFSLLVFMCFGQRVDDEKLNDVERVQYGLLLGINKFNVLNFWPKVTKFLFRKRWHEFLKLMRDQEEVLVPLIRERKKAKESGLLNYNNNPPAYVDTLLDLKLPKEGQRNLDEGEMVTLCSEFLNAGTDTTSTALQWIMANLVKYQQVQQRLVDEIEKIVTMKDIDDKKEKEVINEEDLEKLPYLKAVILEALRRHPPGHFVLPHAVSEDVVLNGYLVPKEGTINFMVAEIGWDPQVWEDPMAFKPERFMNEDCSKVEVFDITGTKEIKMMPFGAGRRICPGYNLALLHLEYFVANLVWNFHWKVPKGGDVDFSEKQEFTIVMKNPLMAHISTRIHH